jgi:hypothetical protein
MPDRQPSKQHHRQACRVGDWVLASPVPEWTTDCVKQTYTPPNRVSAGLFGSSIPAVKDWTFRGCFFIDAAGDPVTIWRRDA